MSLFEPSETESFVQKTARGYAQTTLAPDAARLDREQAFPLDHLGRWPSWA